MITVRSQPCSSCPYRRDVPSGIWEESEYAKLPGYDGDVPDQLFAGATRLFHCHTWPARLCAGWVGCHDMENSAAVRLNHRTLDMDAVLSYVSPVPLFASGAEAAEHGMRDLPAPGPDARIKGRRIARLQAGRSRRQP